MRKDLEVCSMKTSRAPEIRSVLPVLLMRRTKGDGNIEHRIPTGFAGED